MKPSQHDIEEIEEFKQYLADAAYMSRPELYRKYQDYLCLSDEELRALTGHKENS